MVQPHQRAAILCGFVGLVILVRLAPRARRDLRYMSWRERLTSGDLWLAVAVLAITLGTVEASWHGRLGAGDPGDLPF